MTWRVGKFPFFNCVPIFYALETKRVKFKVDIKLVSSSPFGINTLLKKDKLELGFISSGAYLKMTDKCLILPQLSISSWGKVKSVILFSRVPVYELNNQPVLLTGQSVTSILLLKFIFSKYFSIQPRYQTGELGQANGTVRAGLVIGDAALTLQAKKLYPFQLDLGEFWHKLTGFPFVFSVFAVRKTVFEKDKPAMRNIWQILQASKKWGLTHLDTLAQLCSCSEIDLIDYWRCLDYELSPLHLQSLNLFFRYLKEMGKVPHVPRLELAEII